MNTTGRIAVLMVLVCLSFSVVTVSAQATCEAADGEPLQIGAVFPAGQMLRAGGNPARQGVEAMVSAVNACGGVAGRPVELVYESATDRDSAESAAQRLIDEAGVPLIIGSGSAAVRDGIQSVTEPAEVVFWEVTESLNTSNGWSFSTRPNDRQMGELTAQFIQTIAPSLGSDDGVEDSALKVALIYENRQRGQDIASGLSAVLAAEPVILVEYAEDLMTISALRDPRGDTPRIVFDYSMARSSVYQLAADIRDREIDFVVFSGFDDDGADLWYQMREADANVSAWIHIGSEGYRTRLCQDTSNVQAFMSIAPTGAVAEVYLGEVVGDIYDQYRRGYMSQFSDEPDFTADLGASGAYLLLNEVLPSVQGTFTAASIRSAALAQAETDPVGLLGEGLALDADTGLNRAAGAIVRQQQGTRFCSVFPDALATCSEGVMPFPTWRERALNRDVGLYCGSEA